MRELVDINVADCGKKLLLQSLANSKIQLVLAFGRQERSIRFGDLMGRGGVAVDGCVARVWRGDKSFMGNGKVVGVRQGQCEMAKLATTYFLCYRDGVTIELRL